MHHRGLAHSWQLLELSLPSYTHSLLHQHQRDRYRSNGSAKVMDLDLRSAEAYRKTADKWHLFVSNTRQAWQGPW